MATDVDVQFFSHLNGLTLGNNWGDLIRLLDKALVTGIDLTQITGASIDAQGDVHITFYSAHNAMLFQIIELTGFSPSTFNQKYRIKGVPNSTQLILKPKVAISESIISITGMAKLASLGYDIIFRDTNDVKRVYRAKNPSVQHPFIRVDESLVSPDGATGVYTSTYAKSAMVGLLEHMDHIDDFDNPDVLQLPIAASDIKKNWQISNTGLNTVRGWYKWYFATNQGYQIRDADAIPNGNRRFTLIGDVNAFYLLNSPSMSGSGKRLNGCGLYDSALNTNNIPNWFLMSNLSPQTAGSYLYGNSTAGFYPLFKHDQASRFLVARYDLLNRMSNHVEARPIIMDYDSGYTSIFAGSALPALEIPFYDTSTQLRGTLKHVLYAGKNISSATATTPIIADKSMYLMDSAYRDFGDAFIGGLYFYLGELE